MLVVLSLPLLLAENTYAKSIKVMAYNVLYKSSANKKTISTIRDSQADVVCLRELTPKFIRQFNSNLGAVYKQKSFYARKGTWGVGIASKLKLTEVKYFRMRPYGIPAQSAIIHTARAKIMLVCIHLIPPVANQGVKPFLTMIRDNNLIRIAQAKYLVARFSAVKMPVIILGDFNDWRSSESLKIFTRAHYQHACGTGNNSSCGNTFPANDFKLPGVVEIDHIFGKGIKFIRGQVFKRGGSDHYPVQAWIKTR